MTIEERADSIYQQKDKLDKYRQGHYDYVVGAKEQQKIDIEKAWDILNGIIEHHSYDGYFDYLTKEEFTQMMEE